MNAFRLLAMFFALLSPFSVRAAESIPPKPDGYFNDYAGVVSKDAALKFNEQLAQFERETSNQVVVVVYQEMQTDSDIAAYTQRIAQSWKVGQAEERNGVVLFVFLGARKMYIQVGYGLEGALPDVTAFDITERHIKPLFKAGDYEAGLETGINLILSALRGEYTGSGKTVAEEGSTDEGGGGLFLILLVSFIILFIWRVQRIGKRRGWGYSGMGGPHVGGWSSGSSGGWSSGSSSGGGFSGFSGGGGSFGGGGGGSSW